MTVYLTFDKQFCVLDSKKLKINNLYFYSTGRIIFESILRNYPRRIDLWNQYIDQEVKNGAEPRIRALFQRTIHLPIPAKKIKFFFKKYLDYEKQTGNEEGVARVKQMAMDYVQNLQENPEE